MTNDKDNNFDGIDINELFNDFYENPPKYDVKTKPSRDDLTEFNENDCTAPRIYRKRTKPKKKTNSVQTTMYDYAMSISYKNRHFYSSLDNTITTKTITKVQNRPSCEQSSSKDMIHEDLSRKISPDFVDNLLVYLDQRSRNKTNRSK